MKNNGKSKAAKRKPRRTARKLPDSAAAAAGDSPLIAKVLEIIQQTPEVRPEKVAALQEAIAQGTYEIDTRALAKILITKLILNR